MFPIRDHNPSQRTPFVTYLLIAANVSIFISYAPLLADPRATLVFFDRWALIPADASAPRLLTSMFLHGGLMHLGGNMLFLWIFGDNLEDEMGHLRYLLFYLAGGIGAGLAQVVSEPASQIPMVGASGAIAAVMGAYVLMFPRARVDVLVILVFIFRIVPVPAWLMLGLWFALQLAAGTASPPGVGGVAYWAHAGGFVAGVVLALPLWLRRGGPAYWARTHGHPPHPEAPYRMVRTSVPRTGRRR
ncbi:rhomboid family intramembrane serine protease [Roseitranquillus sediminis]|uniref:rhomboid family intramembrane serine protease n=1 Tax=Roseitranquillus sediminis TaxID=2809051 RepID=UPI001D0CAAE0|nr:rhomboid family intramembrane serine protease [Roseitranquillus sediminis]MBM9595393.1 rhomboid family intramembrane serine protease [Roseitranquillus sediminis]